MKAAIRAFFQYSLVERTGFVVIGGLLVVLLAIRCTLSWWLEPPPADPVLSAKLAAAYDAWRASQGEAASENLTAGNDLAKPESFAFDPNTLDSLGFIRLGMPPRAVKGLLNWRRKGKRFRKPEDMKPLYNLPEDCYLRLAPLIRIEAGTAENGYHRAGWAREAGPPVIELNTTDSATLDRWVPGIGAVLAKKIIARREALGGFRSLDQLTEIYRFPDTTMEKLRQRLTVDPGKRMLLDLNTVTLERLSAHPYIGEKIARNIVSFREALGGFTEIGQLRQVPLMTAENYRKIAPCFTATRTR